MGTTETEQDRSRTEQEQIGRTEEQGEQNRTGGSGNRGNRADRQNRSGQNNIT
jgi:hypothetical protein